MNENIRADLRRLRDDAYDLSATVEDFFRLHQNKPPDVHDITYIMATIEGKIKKINEAISRINDARNLEKGSDLKEVSHTSIVQENSMEDTSPKETTG